jgi:hypothetical protein
MLDMIFILVWKTSDEVGNSIHVQTKASPGLAISPILLTDCLILRGVAGDDGRECGVRHTAFRSLRQLLQRQLRLR